MALSPLSTALAALEALAAAGTDPGVGPDYVQGLVRVTPDGTNRGSFIEGVDSLDATRTLLTDRLVWNEIDHADLPKGAAIPVATYFRAIVPEGMVGRTGILTLGSLDFARRSRVKLVEGSHGPEMVLDWEGPLAETNEVWAIVGNDGLLWTWYPGPLTPRLTADLVDDIRLLLEGDWVGKISDHRLAVIDTLAVKLRTN